MNRTMLTYRFPNATFPVQFDFLGERWELEVRPITNATFWVAQFVGPARWHLTHAGDESRLLAELRETGVEVGDRTFVATLLMRLGQLGVAQRAQSVKSVRSG